MSGGSPAFFSIEVPMFFMAAAVGITAGEDSMINI
jgi:hypothetical protein